MVKTSIKVVDITPFEPLNEVNDENDELRNVAEQVEDEHPVGNDAEQADDEAEPVRRSPQQV